MTTYLTQLLELRPSSEAGAGMGLFAKADVPIGIMIPYVAIAEASSPEYKMYNLDAEYCVWESRTYHTVPGLEFNGDPSMLIGVPEKWKFAAHINEPTQYTQNCHFMVNPFLDRRSIMQSFQSDVPVIIAYAITTLPIPKGQELFMHYGNVYERPYSVKDEDTDPDKIQICTDTLDVFFSKNRPQLYVH